MSLLNGSLFVEFSFPPFDALPPPVDFCELLIKFVICWSFGDIPMQGAWCNLLNTSLVVKLNNFAVGIEIKYLEFSPEDLQDTEKHYKAPSFHPPLSGRI